MLQEKSANYSTSEMDHHQPLTSLHSGCLLLCAVRTLKHPRGVSYNDNTNKTKRAQNVKVDYICIIFGGYFFSSSIQGPDLNDLKIALKNNVGFCYFSTV